MPERKVDRWLVVPLVLLLGLSVLMVFSTTAIQVGGEATDSLAYTRRHLIHIVFGVVMLIAALRVDPRKLEQLAPILLGVAFLGLILVLIPGVGHTAGGARRWLFLGPIRVQPGELAKVVFTLYIASYIARHERRMGEFLSGVVIPFLIVGAAGGLLLMQPDFGTTVILMSVMFFQLVTVSRLRHLIGVGLAGVFLIGALAVSSPYRFRRLESFLNPFADANGSGYQLIQSLIAVGSGGLGGQGLGAGKQKLFYLPASHTDFIFAVIAEELGLIGATAVVLLFLLIALRGVKVARRLAFDPFLSNLALGCTLIIVLPAFLNIGVVLGLFPTKGLVLPLVAYGGTAMVMHLLAYGVLLRLSSIEGQV